PDPVEVPVLLGPRDDWFADPESALRATVWTVGSASNRVGLRLQGPPLARRAEREGGEVPREPMLPGAVAVAPRGHTGVFVADGPRTGGCPVVAVVPEKALPVLARARPGARLRLRPR